MHWIGCGVIWKRIAAIKFLMKDKNVSIWKKLLIALGIVYVVSPVDLIPIVVFPFAWIDDFILWIWILWFLKDELDKYWLGEKEADLSKKFYGKDIVEGVEYEVSESPRKKEAAPDKETRSGNDSEPRK